VSKSARLQQRRAAAAAAAEARRRASERRRRFAWAGGAIGAVVLVLVGLVVVKLAGGGPTPAVQASADPSTPQVLAAVTSVPESVLDQVGMGKVDSLPKRLSGEPALTADGKPLVVYVGAEYCPFCAAQRWGMVVALSRFGSFSNLSTTHSSSSDTYPNTATLSFHGATYTSDYLAFQGVEKQSNVRQGNTYATLDSLTPQQTQLLQKYNAPPYVPSDSAGAIPFIDFGNQYLSSGAAISPGLLAGQSGSDIAAALSDPSSPIGQAIGGSANAFTAAICALTGNQPAQVCTGTAVTAYAGKLNAG
jgi:Domain of unknown function (DUF929)